MDFNNALSQLAQGFQNKQRMDDFDRLYSASPQYAQGYYDTLNQNRRTNLMEQEQQRQMQQRDALRQLAGSIGINPSAQGELNQRMGGNDFLRQYAQITGDLDPLIRQESAVAPAALRQVDWYLNASPEERAAYDRVNKVGLEKVDLGDRTVFVDKTTGNIVGGGLEKQLEPQQEPDYIREAEAAKFGGKFMEEARLMLPKAQRTLASAELRDEFLDSKINDISARANPWTTGFTGSIGSALPGSAAYDLKSDIETLLANSGFDRLQEMRDNSPTGGALGQVSERELGLLQAAAQNLQQSQSYEQFQKNLQAFQVQRRRSLEQIRKAYEEDYNRYGGKQDQYLPAPQASSNTISAMDFLNE